MIFVLGGSEMKGYTHMTRDERSKLEGFLGLGLNKSQIARQLNRSLSTIKREIKRGLYDRNVNWYFEKHYSADIGQKVHDENATAKALRLKSVTIGIL